jgi:aerobic-type carbon monoxide dehydrogenase small subunit (CoxS/CutS family)
MLIIYRIGKSTKSMIRIHLGLLADTLKETNTVVGIMINKQDFNKSQLAFVDYDSFQKGNCKDGFVVSLDELNKGILRGQS